MMQIVKLKLKLKLKLKMKMINVSFNIPETATGSLSRVAFGSCLSRLASPFLSYAVLVYVMMQL